MKYKYKFKKIKGKCNTCMGCNLLEREDFEGYYRCENYIKEDMKIYCTGDDLRKDE